MSTKDNEINPYELLSLTLEATEQEIKTAYRQRSLKVHPDRNPNNPDAARKFHELNQAYELLLDPLRRLALDVKQRIKEARKERFKSYDNKRKNLVEELEERERAFKKARMDKQKEEKQAWHDTERIKDEGRKLREQKEKELKEKMYPRPEAPMKEEVEEEAPPAMDTLDTTVRLRYPLKSYPNLASPASIASLLSRFGETDESSIVCSATLKGKSSEKLPKYGSALVPFKQIGDAFAAVCSSGSKDMGLDGIKITWVNGKEPEILGWLRKIGKIGNGKPVNEKKSATPVETASKAGSPPKSDRVKATLPQNQSRTTSSSTPFFSFPSTFPETFPDPEPTATLVAPGIDYESLTLMRMRQAERERLEREILEQEANE